MKHLKQFFETPKKTALSLACISAALALLGTGTVFAANAISGNRFNIGKVTLQEAKSKALSDAGLKDSEAVFTKAVRDFDDGIFVYDIGFYAGNTEYEYEINEETGAIYSKSKETMLQDSGPAQDGIPQQKDAPPQSSTPKQDSTLQNNTLPQDGGTADIGVDKAKEIAVSHAGFSVSDVYFSKAKLEDDYGREIYEIKFYKDGMEYEYEINAAAGEILEFDSEWDD